MEGAAELPEWAWALPLLVAGAWALTLYALSRVGGWHALARSYREQVPAAGERIRFRSARVGLVDYNACLTLSASPIGLHLSILLPFRLGHPALFFPWSEVAAVPARHRLRPCVRLGFAREPRVALLLPQQTARQLAAASLGGLRLPGRR